MTDQEFHAINYRCKKARLEILKILAKYGLSLCRTVTLVDPKTGNTGWEVLGVTPEKDYEGE